MLTNSVVARRKDADEWLAKAEKHSWSEKVLRLNVGEKNGKPDPKARPKRIVLSATPEWERAAEEAGQDTKAWLIEGANRAAKEALQ